MKNSLFFISVLGLLIIAITINSCDNILNDPPKGSLNDNVLKNEKGAYTLLIGAYAALDGQNVGGGQWSTSPDNWIYGSVAGGAAHKGSDVGDISQVNSIATGTAEPSNSFLNDKWKANYEGVARANDVLKILHDVKDIPESVKNQFAGEARFLRAHYYFDLKKMFNMVPLIDENTTDYNQPNDVDIWPFIEADFEFAMNNIPEIQSEVGRANKWAAASYLAKTYVYQQKWNEAKSLFDDIIANGVTATGQPYALVENFKDNFDPATKNHSESIFAIQMTGQDGTGTIANSNQGSRLNYPFGGPFRCCGAFQPTQDLVNSYQTSTTTGLPTIDSYNNSMVKNDMNIESGEKFTPHEGSLDPRLDWTVGRRGVPYHDWGPFPGKVWVRDQRYGGPYYGQKHIWWQATQDQYYNGNSWSPGTAVNYIVIRFADVLLMAAEAEVELGNLERARQLVNQVRERVSSPDGWVDNELNESFALAVVDNEAAMLNSGATVRQWVVRTDRNSTFVLLGGDATDINNWQEYKDPAANYNMGIYPTGHPAFQNQSSAREAVHFERKLELAMEGHRFFDLVRWGEGPEKLNAYFEYEGALFPDVTGGSFTSNKNEYYPIPQRQIDLSAVGGEPVLKQNAGYQ